jgi:hypothetical protein
MPPNKSLVNKPKAQTSLSIRPVSVLSEQDSQRFADLEAKYSNMESNFTTAIQELREQIVRLSAEKGELLAQLALTTQQKEAAEKALEFEKAKEKPRNLVSYADIASVPTGPAPVIGQKRPLTREEVSRIQRGLGPQARSEFIRIYFEGQQRNRLSFIRDTFRFAGCDMRKIFDISFVGKSVMMILTKEEAKLDIIRCLKEIDIKYLEDFDELDSKWMARSLRDKGSPCDGPTVKAMALEKFIARITSRRDAIINKSSNTHGYYSRVLREAEASLQGLKTATAQSVAESKDELDELPSIEELMSVDTLTTEPCKGQSD